MIYIIATLMYLLFLIHKMVLVQVSEVQFDVEQEVIDNSTLLTQLSEYNYEFGITHHYQLVCH